MCFCARPFLSCSHAAGTGLSQFYSSASVLVSILLPPGPILFEFLSFPFRCYFVLVSFLFSYLFCFVFCVLVYSVSFPSSCSPTFFSLFNERFRFVYFGYAYRVTTARSLRDQILCHNQTNQSNTLNCVAGHGTQISSTSWTSLQTGL